MNTDEFMSLVEAAVLAPSADNRHLFRLQHSGAHIRLWALDEFTSAPQHLRVLCLISFGAAAENMRIRAAKLGLEAHVEWFPNAAKPQLVGELKFTRVSGRGADALDIAMPQRHTNRRLLFRGPRLSPTELEALGAELEGPKGVELTWLDSPTARQQILRLSRIAETERVRSRRLHEELFSAIRFDVGWNSSASEGLPPASLEVEAPLRPIFGALRHWSVLRLLKPMGVHHSIGLRAAYLPCRLAPHVGALTTSLDLDPGALAAGAAFERVWLRATLQGLSLQPIAGSAILALPGYRGVSDNVQKTLSKGWQRLVPNRTPMMLFRIGHAAPPSVRTKRRPLSDYVLP